jgi:hypothetical protein
VLKFNEENLKKQQELLATHGFMITYYNFIKTWDLNALLLYLNSLGIAKLFQKLSQIQGKALWMSPVY